jgi:hypothetical protein
MFMKKIAITALISALFFGSASASAGDAPVGQFVMAGPTNAIAEELSMRWQYGLMLSVDSQEITEVKFSCDPIPGTTFAAKGNELRRLKNGALFMEGPVLVVSNETTPWLFETTTTSANCTAAVSIANKPEAIITARVNFASAMKSATMKQLKMAHEFNRPVKK